MSAPLVESVQALADAYAQPDFVCHEANAGAQHACTIAWASIPGAGRMHNEDAVWVSEAAGLAMLADGAGGFNAGELASRTALQTMAMTLDDLPSLRADQVCTQAIEAVDAANQAVIAAGRAHPESQGLATTLVFARVDASDWVYGHVGDSRAYLLRERVLVQLTSDHAFVRPLDEPVPGDELATVGASTRMLTRALGVDGASQPDVRQLPARAGDLMVLCSRGLSAVMDKRRIADCLLTFGPDVYSAAQFLIHAASSAGAVDDASVVVIRPDQVRR